MHRARRSPPPPVPPPPSPPPREHASPPPLHTRMVRRERELPPRARRKSDSDIFSTQPAQARSDIFATQQRQENIFSTQSARRAPVVRIPDDRPPPDRPPTSQRPPPRRAPPPGPHRGPPPHGGGPLGGARPARRTSRSCDSPPPRFSARYGDDAASVATSPARVGGSGAPPRHDDAASFLTAATAPARSPARPPRGPEPPAKKYEVVFTVPPDGLPGDRLSCRLPHGPVASAPIPPGRAPGEQFSALWPPLPARGSDAGHACEVCGRGFRSASHLRIHAKTHTRAVNAVPPPERHRIVPHPARVDRVPGTPPAAAVPPRPRGDPFCVACKIAFPTRIALELHRSRLACAAPARFLKESGTARRRFWLGDAGLRTLQPNNRRPPPGSPPPPDSEDPP